MRRSERSGGWHPFPGAPVSRLVAPVSGTRFRFGTRFGFCLPGSRFGTGFGRACGLSREGLTARFPAEFQRGRPQEVRHNPKIFRNL